jgi:penicillin-binding protein 2
VNNRIWLLLLVVYAVLGLYAVRLFQLQVVHYEKYATRSQGNYLRTETLLAPRGRIFDRNGKLIAGNRLTTDLVYSGGEILFKERILRLLGLKQLPEVSREPVTLKANLPENLVLTLAELTAGQDNLQLVERLERTYPRPISGPVLGYVLFANKQEVEDEGYDPRELVGRTGLEAALEKYLRGRKGQRVVEKNVRGERVSEQITKEPVPGQDVYLTIDIELQQVAERVLQESLDNINKGRSKYHLPLESVVKGAIVAVDPRTGEVLAMASVPSFDPALFARYPRTPEDNKKIAALNSDKSLPTLNRAVTAYAPGSTFKLVSSSYFIEKTNITPNTVFTCSPYIKYGGIRKNWYAGNMGPMTVREAIAQSCNTWYYQAAIAADPYKTVDGIAEWASKLGIGRPTGLEIAEDKGFLPTRRWKEETFKEPWYPGQSLSVAIGQDAVEASPVQIARMLTTIVNSGRQPELHLVRRIGTQAVQPRFTQIEGKYWSVLQEGMRKTVTWGTARPLMESLEVPTAGKTGTAENGMSYRKGYGYTHAWYMGYGPAVPGDPRPPLVVVAFFENGGEGFNVALPAVKRVMEAYWKIGEFKPKPPEAQLQAVPAGDRPPGAQPQAVPIGDRPPKLQTPSTPAPSNAAR